MKRALIVIALVVIAGVVWKKTSGKGQGWEAETDPARR